MSEYSKIIGTIEITCPNCKHNISNQRIMNDQITEFGECVNCGKMTYHKILNPITSQEKQSKPLIKCPYCQSTNVKKISKSSKLAHGITFGIFAASKLVNQWHCNNCKSDF